MRSFYTLQELAGLPGLPGTVPGVRKLAERMGWEGQRRLGSKAVEYSFSQLPVETQTALLALSVSGDAAAPKESLPAVNTSQAVKVSDRLNDTQKAVMVARLCFVREIERMSVAVSQSRAIDILVKQARDCALSPYLMERVDLANDRKTGDRGLSERTLKRWIAAYKAHGESGLAPLRQRPNLAIPEWAKEFLRCYQRPTKPSVAASYMEFASVYGGTVPSIHAVKRFLKKLSPDALNAGRMSPQELKSLQSFRRRSTKNLFPGDVYTADGHKFDAEVINPLTGKPYRPEITTVLDVATRKVVGVSVGESESAIGVLDALRDAIRECMFAIFYVDNGSGFANDTVREVVDRIGGTMTHSLPYNSQARGLSERGHQTIWVRAAKKLTSYIGADMDKHAGTRVHRIGRKELREMGKSQVLPTFAEFMSGMEHEIAAYNSTPHRGLSKFRDPETGVLRHMTPNEAWQAAISEGWEPIVAPSSLVDSLMRPQVIRKSRRGEIAWSGNTYFAPDLTAFHDQEIRIAYDVRDASQIWAYTLDGELIGAAQLDGNTTDYMPRTMVEQAREKREKGQFKRAVDKLEVLTGHHVEMIAPSTAPSAALQQDERAAALEYAREVVAQRPSFEIPDNDVARYRLWKKLDTRQASGEELDDFEARWWKSYSTHPDLTYQRELMEGIEKHAG
ncbi:MULTISPECIES: DNA-binding protein [unclassified Pseudomonas]|uniref:DNA-binding protein n=1 Tax=unclassified Pseudomonas TaxID=196821 RepID=UPI0011A6C6F9|nr:MULTISPECIES: DNA-binding protein [unclassified Pseudomonas]TWC21075.1 putative transposase [Pseudomonas sp. SJZ075]TWC36555.1 putative transposase [Pseudomonas sp. SJZ078]TWC57314.1 putative transposase [Pseudomonas sp. SJZ124]TWC92389.1 putative transposase [Pseudomonas sp. SJZ101]